MFWHVLWVVTTLHWIYNNHLLPALIPKSKLLKGCLFPWVTLVMPVAFSTCSIQQWWCYHILKRLHAVFVGDMLSTVQYSQHGWKNMFQLQKVFSLLESNTVSKEKIKKKKKTERKKERKGKQQPFHRSAALKKSYSGLKTYCNCKYTPQVQKQYKLQNLLVDAEWSDGYGWSTQGEKKAQKAILTVRLHT